MGIGHIMRCIAIAQAWKKRGGSVTFISHLPGEKISSRIRSEGFELIKLEGLRSVDGDIDQTMGLLKSQSQKKERHSIWVILDGYHFTTGLQKEIMSEGFRLLVIDDYNHLEHYQADILLNQNIGSDRHIYSSNSNAKPLLGTKYIMLRNEFLEYKRISSYYKSKAKNILIAAGGTDPENIAGKLIIALLKRKDHQQYRFKVIIGPGNFHIDQLTKLTQNKHPHIRFKKDADMIKMMAWADIAVTTGGGTCWELCFMGIPFLVVAIAENQIEQVAGLIKKDVAVLLDDKKMLYPDKAVDDIFRLAENRNKLNRLKENGTTLVDGQGTKRIIRKMLVLDLKLRKADMDDAALLFEWANEAEIRKASFNTDPIKWSEHISWMKKKLIKKEFWIFIAENHLKSPVGLIRLEKEKNIFKISYLMDKKFRGLGLGKSILDKGIKKIETILDLPAVFEGAVKKDNIASMISFEKSGFTRLPDKKTSDSPQENHHIYQLKLQ